jgi:2,4-dienoyl-CoA reductase-like NADH-dependent reductase (Old Yellow Enzyme family)
MRRTEWEHAPGIWNSEQVDGWRKIVEAVHAEGTLIYAQLWHGKGPSLAAELRLDMARS